MIKIKTKSKISCKNTHRWNANVSVKKGNQQNIKSGLQLLKTILCEIVFCVFPFSSVDLFLKKSTSHCWEFQNEKPLKFGFPQ